MGKGGFRNEAFEKNGKRGGGARHGRLDDEKQVLPRNAAERFRIEKKDSTSPLKQGSLKADTIDFLQGIVSLTMWIPELEQALEREGFVKETQDGDGNRRVYLYPKPAGGAKKLTFTPKEALRVLKDAMESEDVVAEVSVQAQNAEKKTGSLSGEEHGTQKKEETKILNDTIVKGMEAVKKERSVTDVSSIPLGHGKLERESIQYIHSMTLGKNPPITKDLLTILRNAGYSAYLIRMKGGDKEIPKKVKVSLANDKSHVWELTQKEIIDLLERHIQEQSRVAHDVKNRETTANPDELPEVDMTEVKNPFSIRGDLEESDQGAGADKLDINDYRKIEDELERRRDEIVEIYKSKKEAPSVIVDTENKSEISDAEDVTDKVAFRFKKILDISDAEIISERKRGEKKFFDTRFETEFGITEEQLSQIEGYERLSEGQQKLVLENLREYARDTRGGYLSRAWEGILKSTGRETKDKNYIDAVTVLIRNTAQFGPKVHEEGGELLTDFIGIETSRPFRKEHKPIFDRFNALAHQYAKTKVEDLEDGIGTHSKDESKLVSFLKNTFSESRRKNDAYESLQESYENAKRELAQSLAEMGKSEGEIAEKLIEIDSKVHSLRFLQTEPEAVDVIKQNPDKSFWQKAGEKVFSKENIAYAGLGFVGRMALTGAMGLYAAPVVASAVGGIRSWNKTAAELREADRAVRGGERKRDPKIDVIKGEMNVIIEKQKSMHLSDTEKRENSEYKELVEKLDGLNERLIRITGVELNVIDVSREIDVGGKKKEVGVTHKLEDLIERYKSFEYEGGKIGDRNDVLKKMQARVQYIEDKVKLNRINFGSGAERAINMAKLFEVLGEAQVLLANTDMPKQTEIKSRLDQYLISREGLIQTRRRKKQIKTAALGTLKAGALALAGRELAEYGKEAGFFDKVTSGVSGLFGSTASVPQSAEAPLPKQYGYQAEVRAVDNKIISKTEVSPAERVETGTKDVSAEPAPKPVSPSSSTQSAQIPSSQTVEELQKASVESGSEDKLYSDAKSDIGNEKSSPSPTDEGVKTNEGGDVSDEALEQQKGDGPVRFEESSPIEEQHKSPTSSEPIRQSSTSPDEVIEVKGYPPIKTIEANDHVWSKVPEEGVRIPKDLEVSDIVSEVQAEGGSSRPYLGEDSLSDKEPSVSDAGTSADNSVESDIRWPETTIPDYSEDGGTVLDTESNAPEAKSTPNVLGSQETFINTNGVEVDPKKEHIYELTGQGGEKAMVSYGGKDFGTRFDTAQEYVQKNPEAVVVVEEEPRYGVFGQKLPPSYVEVRNIPGEGVTTIFSIQDDTLPASSEKGIDPSTFTKKVTK